MHNAAKLDCARVMRRRSLPEWLGASACSDERAAGKGDGCLDEACFHTSVRGCWFVIAGRHSPVVSYSRPRSSLEDLSLARRQEGHRRV